MYTRDGRRAVESLFKQYDRCVAAGWSRETICQQSPTDPLYAFFSPCALNKTTPAPALWALGGIHGDEPAPPEAFADEINTLMQSGLHIPIVLLPLLNPVARRNDWRYENEYRDVTLGASVTDCDHLLLDAHHTPRRPGPISETARRVTQWVVAQSKRLTPLLVIDHHEDRMHEHYHIDGSPKKYSSCYLYVSSRAGATNRVAHHIIDTINRSGMRIQTSGKTRYKELIHNGMIDNPQDGSIDEFFAAEFSPNTVVVMETTVPFPDHLPLQARRARVEIHRAIIRSYPLLWKILNK